MGKFTKGSRGEMKWLLLLGGWVGVEDNLAPVPIWHRSQFGTKSVKRSIWHQECKRVNLAPVPIWHQECKGVNLTPGPIWHRDQFETINAEMDNLTPWMIKKILYITCQQLGDMCNLLGKSVGQSKNLMSLLGNGLTWSEDFEKNFNHFSEEKVSQICFDQPSYFFIWCQIGSGVKFVPVSNWLFCTLGVKLVRCQIGAGVKLTPLHSWCQIGTGVKLTLLHSWCQIGAGVKLSSNRKY